MRKKIHIHFITNATWILMTSVSAMINPNFTPIHLVDESNQIFFVRPRKLADTKSFSLIVEETLKGKTTELFTANLQKAKPRQAEMAIKVLSGKTVRPCLLFIGGKGKKRKGFLHIRGTWLLFVFAQSGELEFVQQSSELLAVWNGGTDMLARCVKYILAKKGKADVPVNAGMTWEPIVRIGSVEGTPSSVVAVNLKGDGTPFLHIGSSKGDRIFQGVKEGEDEEVEDVTGRMKLLAKSAASAWDDFNADGRLDLVSWDGSRLVVWLQEKNGTFRPSESTAVSGMVILNMVALASKSSDVSGLLVFAKSGISILISDGKGQFSKPIGISSPKPLLPKLGRPQKGIVADFTNDGFSDVIQPYEKGGLFYRGKKDFSFEPAKPCAVASEIGNAVSAAADFDGDGMKDIVLCGDAGTHIYQNLGEGKFAESLAESGEISYKAARFASWCDAADFNSDGRPDLLTTYHEQKPDFYFNRGFRSFGYAVTLLGLLDRSEMNANEGQQAGTFADMNSDDQLDTILVLNNGEVWCLFNLD